MQKLQDLNTVLTQKQPTAMEAKAKENLDEDDPFAFLETQSDNNDMASEWDDPFEFNVTSRGSNKNRNFNLLNSKISPFLKISDDTLIKGTLILPHWL